MSWGGGFISTVKTMAGLPASGNFGQATGGSSGGSAVVGSSGSYSNPFSGVAPIAATFASSWYPEARRGLTSFTGDDQMAYFDGRSSDVGFPSTYNQSGGFWGGLLDVGSRILPGVIDYLNQPNETTGGPDYPGADAYPGEPMSRAMWYQTRGGYRQLQDVVINSPTGQIGVWKAAGRPILFSGDLAACRRVSRVAARASRAVGRSRGRSGYRRRRGGR